MNIRTYEGMNFHMYLHTNVHTHVPMQVHIYTSICTYMNIIHKYIIHTYIIIYITTYSNVQVFVCTQHIIYL